MKKILIRKSEFLEAVTEKELKKDKKQKEDNSSQQPLSFYLQNSLVS